jgi:vesicle-fusing ATPase
MLDTPSSADPPAFLPGVRGSDGLGQFWLSQVTLRLRREVCWQWRERDGRGAAAAVDADARLPVDRAQAALDLLKYERDKRAFFADDVTARYLSGRIGAPSPRLAGDPRRGSFGWVVRELELRPVECFVLAVALLPSVDSAAGDVIAQCLGDPLRTRPSLGLAQRLWDEPDDLLRCFDPAHALMRYGLLATAGGAGSDDWHAPVWVSPMVASELLFAGASPSDTLDPIVAATWPAGLDGRAVARVSSAVSGTSGRRTQHGMRVVPVIGHVGAPLAEVAAACGERAGVPVVRLSKALPREQLAQALTAAWLRGAAVFLPVSALANASAPDAAVDPPPLSGLPLTVFVGAHDRAALRGLSATLPPIVVPPLTYAERLAHWRAALPSGGDGLAELARRFRYEELAIARIGRELAALEGSPSHADMLAAARADLDLGTLAQPVTPRFSRAELMLPAAQSAHIDDIVAAMNNLTRAHFEWGTARAWNESGLAVLFAGPPGTGKTMAAEAIAAELDVPLYRIDLSQVVNKYIGETEKNLRRLFDAADSADVILFFDEADALFGKRTEVKDAHDRYANLEISYLLERMERFRGLAILATNRKKDLDEAFLRRLRFVVEFPLPGADERLRIWRSVIPPGVDVSGVDFDFLAQRFQLAGGHIRGIVFQACLQSASAGAPIRLDMPALVRAVQREYDKLDRANSLEQFGPYASLVSAQRTAR